MEHDRLEPFNTTRTDEHSRERLLQAHVNTNDQAHKEHPARFKSLHRPRASSTSSYASQPEEDANAPSRPDDYSFPSDGDRGRTFFRAHDETNYGGHYAPIHGPSQLWLPFWLSKPVLICFLLLFASLLIALILVYYANLQRNGFHVAASTSPYSWTYGPTAVLVILVGLWRMVDFYCKSLTPWDELRHGPVVASRSLLLDYLSPLQLSSLLKALGNGHVAVMSTIMGFIILKTLVSPPYQKFSMLWAIMMFCVLRSIDRSCWRGTVR